VVDPEEALAAAVVVVEEDTAAVEVVEVVVVMGVIAVVAVEIDTKGGYLIVGSQKRAGLRRDPFPALFILYKRLLRKNLSARLEFIGF
jgi:hypothetical protein